MRNKPSRVRLKVTLYSTCSLAFSLWHLLWIRSEAEKGWFILWILWEVLLLFWEREGEEHLQKIWQEVATPTSPLLFWPPLLIFLDFHSGKKEKDEELSEGVFAGLLAFRKLENCPGWRRKGFYKLRSDLCLTEHLCSMNIYSVLT